MQPIHFAESNFCYKAPADWDEKTNGPCADLHVFQNDDSISSVWKPSPEELAQLNAGGAVVLTVVANFQPPVRLWTAPLEPITEDEPVVESVPEEDEPSQIIEEPHTEVVDNDFKPQPLGADEEHDTIQEIGAKRRQKLN
jgi:hypothetical protein